MTWDCIDITGYGSRFQHILIDTGAAQYELIRRYRYREVEVWSDWEWQDGGMGGHREPDRAAK